MTNIKSVVKIYLTELKGNLEHMFYARALSILVKDRIRIENNLKNADLNEEKITYQHLITELNVLISFYRNYQFNLLKGKSSFDAVDALGACLVYDIKRAKNILYHASIYSNISRQIAFQTLMDDLLIEKDGVIGLPSLLKVDNFGVYQIGLTPRDKIVKDLSDTYFKGHLYKLDYTMQHGTITNYYEIGKRLLRFFKTFDGTINKTDLMNFYIALTRISLETVTPLDIDRTKEKINNIFIQNKNLNRKFCVLIDLSRNYITSIIDLRESLSRFFTKDSKLASATLRKYLSEDVYIKENSLLFEEEVRGICRI